MSDKLESVVVLGVCASLTDPDLSVGLLDCDVYNVECAMP